MEQKKIFYSKKCQKYSLLLTATIAVVTVISATNFLNQISLCFNTRESNHCVGRGSFGTKVNAPLQVVFDLNSSFQQNAKDKNVTNPIFTTYGN